MVEIVQVTNRRLLHTFVRFPFTLYKDNPYWVPPLLSDDLFTLDKKRNPVFAFSESAYWLARKDGRWVGRIAGIISHAYIEKWGNRYARFGWIDFIDDREVSRALLDTVENWAKEKGLAGAHGPLGFCDLDKEGMLVEGFEEPGTFISIYNHPYYAAHLEALGYAKDAEWVEWDVRITRSEQTDKLKKLADRAAEKHHMRMVKLNKPKDVVPYIPAIFDLLNQGYEHLYGVVPVTKKMVDSYVKQFFGFLDPDFISIILDEKDVVAGFGINMPSLAEASRKSGGRLFPFGFIHWLHAIRHPKLLDLYLVAVRPELRRTGIPFIMLSELTEAAIRRGVTQAIASPELETNTAVHSMWRNYDARIHRRRRAYLKNWENNASGTDVAGISS